MPYDGPGRVICDEKYDHDMFQCRFTVSARYRAARENQAMQRYAACLSDNGQVPPFIYYQGD